MLQFLEPATKLLRPFRYASPLVPSDSIDEPRQEMTHDCPEVSPERVRAFAREGIPQIVRRLRLARFPADGIQPAGTVIVLGSPVEPGLPFLGPKGVRSVEFIKYMFR